MALASRTARRSATRRWLLLGVLATVVVLLINAAMSARSAGPARQLANQTWLDQASTVISQSSQDGQDITEIRTDALKLSGTVISRRLDQAAASAATTLAQLRKIIPPSQLQTPASLLVATMAVRAQASRELARAMTAALSNRQVTMPSPTPSSTGTPTTVTESPTAALAQAGADMSLGDRTYQLFQQYLPANLGFKPPPSVWLSDPTAYQPTQLQVFVSSLKSAATLAPVHNVGILVVSTVPSPLSINGGVQMLPATSDVTLQVVVADTGNQPEHNLTVSASMTPALYSQTQTVRQFTDLSPGQSQTIQLGGLVPKANQPFTLTVTVTTVKGEQNTGASTKVLHLQVG